MADPRAAAAVTPRVLGAAPVARGDLRWSAVGERGACVLLALSAAVAIAAYGWVALHRLGYPYELQWMEGGSVELVGRVLAGHTLYSSPSLAFAPWPYPPLFFWASAGLAKVVGLGFLPLRLVSLVSSVGALALLGAVVMYETGDRLAALATAGLYVATFRRTGAWFDIGRVDSMFMALTLATLLVGRRAHATRGGLVVGVLAFASFATKQTALVALAPLLLVLLATRPRVGLPATAVLVTLLGASTLAGNALTHGWYGFFVFSELAHQPVVRGQWTGFWTHDVLGAMPLALVAIVGGATFLARHARERGRGPVKKTVLFYVAAAGGLLAAGWSSRLHSGGFDNVLMPAYAALALLAGLSLALVRGAGAGVRGAGAGMRGAGAGVRPGGVMATLLAVALVAQIALLRYPLGAQLPTAADARAGDQLIAELRSLPGRVLVPDHPYYATLAGKGTSAQQAGLGDLLRSGGGRGQRALRASLPGSLRAMGIDAVVLDNRLDEGPLADELRRDFVLTPRRLISGQALLPVTDLRQRPERLFLRR